MQYIEASILELYKIFAFNLKEAPSYGVQGASFLHENHNFFF